MFTAPIEFEQDFEQTGERGSVAIYGPVREPFGVFTEPIRQFPQRQFLCVRRPAPVWGERRDRGVKLRGERPIHSRERGILDVLREQPKDCLMLAARLLGELHTLVALKFRDKFRRGFPRSSCHPPLSVSLVAYSFENALPRPPDV
jgi:hypothetical protein